MGSPSGAALQLQVEQTGFFSRSSPLPTLGRPTDVIAEVFNMHVGEARLFILRGQPAVVRLKERTGFDAEAYTREKSELKDRLLRLKREQGYTQWLSDLRQQAEGRSEISINQNWQPGL